MVDADDALAHLVLGPLLSRLLLLLRREVGAVRASLLPLAVLEHHLAAQPLQGVVVLHGLVLALHLVRVRARVRARARVRVRVRVGVRVRVRVRVRVGGQGQGQG